jgi:protocatechuate 3,4-dioxygenase beta subunit
MAQLTRRRDVLAGLGTAALVPVVGCTSEPVAASRSRRLIAGGTCPVTPRQTEGPFYFDPRLVRQDIREGRPGLVLRLRLQIVAATDCVPAEHARLDIWHCDAAGAYSGYDREATAGETWLRGTQHTDGDGVAAFETIYPGWYAGRATHIHCKAWMAGGREITSQIYFPDDLSDRVYAQGPYAGRGGDRLRNGDDGIFGRAGEAAPVAEVVRTQAGLEGAVVLALR